MSVFRMLAMLTVLTMIYLLKHFVSPRARYQLFVN